MTHSVVFRLGFCVMGIGMLCSAWAQREPVLRGAQVTESALIEALAIDGPPAPTKGQTRGFRPSKATPYSRPASTAPGKASLLITFTVDSADLSSETTSVLDTVAKALQSDQLTGFSFKIEGHADPRGSAEGNQKLSERRAEAVVNYLVTRHGILPERLAPIGKGSNELMDPRRPDAPVNRRVTIVTNKS